MHVMWACEWKRTKALCADIRQQVETLKDLSFLYPRDAFFGGRTETFKLYQGEGPIEYEDVTSLYPWVNFQSKYPIGHPEIILNEFGKLDDYFGLIKCRILPPKNLYIPVLPMHCGKFKKLVFALCSACAENFQVDICTHEDYERALTGTWFSEEIKLAVENGYCMIEILTVWHFPQSADDLFKEYVKFFYKIKLVSSNINCSSDEEWEQFIKNTEIYEGIKIQSKHEFRENPGLRQLAKLMLNNLWGRFGMREKFVESKFVSKFEDLLKLIDDETLEVTGVRPVTAKTAQVLYTVKNNDLLPMSKDTNIFIAVATTAYARIRLYKELAHVGERLLYCDTDSVIYKRSLISPAENLERGNFLGQMTNELDDDDHIVEFVSGGPKNYAYRTANKKCCVKVKGFTLNSTNVEAFSFENLKTVILGGVQGKEKKHEERSVLFERHVECGERNSAVCGSNGISVYNQTKISRTRDWRVVQKTEQKFYSFCFDKRIILPNFDTVPYGYVR